MDLLSLDFGKNLHLDTVVSLLSIPSSLIWTLTSRPSRSTLLVSCRPQQESWSWTQPLPTALTDSSNWPVAKTACRFGTCHPTDHIAAMPEPHTIVASSPPNLQPPTTFKLARFSEDGLGGTGDGRWGFATNLFGMSHRRVILSRRKRGGISRTEDTPSHLLLHKASAEKPIANKPYPRPASGTLTCRVPRRDPAWACPATYGR